jgi:hypothetical protein
LKRNAKEKVLSNVARRRIKMRVNTIFVDDWEKKLSKLSKTKLEHLIQLKNIEIENYKEACVNYPENRKKYAVSYLNKLNEQLGYIEQVLRSK